MYVKKEDVNIEKILNGYFRGEANADEIKRLLNWLGELPEHRKQYDILQDFWKSSSLKIEVADKEYSYKRILTKIKADTAEGGQERPQRRRIPYLHGYRIAAAVAVLFIALVTLYFLNNGQPAKEVAQPVGGSVLLVSGNKAGEKSRLILSDGSIVWLNSESELSYPDKFTGAEREVILKGEAFFEVAKDPGRPFVVKSGTISTTALGTTFNVSSFAEDDNIVISLVTGKVKVSVNGGETYFLEPGYQMNYNRNENTASKSNFNISNVISWKDGILIFSRENFQNVKRKLERWFAVDIVTHGQPPADFVITGQFNRNESLETVLENMRYGRHFNYMIVGKEVTIDFN